MVISLPTLVATGRLQKEQHLVSSGSILGVVGLKLYMNDMCNVSKLITFINVISL